MVFHKLPSKNNIAPLSISTLAVQVHNHHQTLLIQVKSRQHLLSIIMPVAAKRKKTEDMPDSPPKRVTRARAKTTEAAEPKALPKKTATATKPSTCSKKAANQSRNTTKRKTRADDAAEQIEEGPKITDEKPNEGAKLRGRTAKTDAAAVEQQDASKEEKPKARTRKPAVTRAANVVKVEALKTRRGRSNKGEDGTGAVDGQGEKEIEQSVATKKTSHVKATTKRSQETATKPAPRAAAAKKRVKFEEDPLTDKENVPLPTKSKGKGSEETTGLKAKPVRKPATSKPAPAMSTVATRRAVKTKGNTGNITQDEKPMPLSPKKVTQVAKPASVGSEDELSGGKTPIRAFSRSPIKQPQSVKKRVDDSPVKFNFGNPSATTSPIKIFSASVLTSPARRPPPSPFKDAMRESPKRGGIVAPQSSIKQSSNNSPFKNSLQISPKRGVLFSANKPNLAQPSIVQSSLLKSPARRPIGSPDKSIFALSPVKSVKKPNTSALKIHREEEEQDTPSTKSASSPFRAGHSASVKIKPYTFTSPELNKEQAAKGSARKAVKGFDDPSSRSATPRNFQCLSSTFDDAGTFNLDFETLAKSSPIINDAVDVSGDHRQGDVDEVEVEQRTTTPDGQPRYAVVSATEEEVGSYRESAQDDESEDELSSPSKATFDLRLSMFGISTKDFAANPFMKRVSISPMKAQPGILTPLAAKLSSWGASSPQKLSRNEEKVADLLMDEILATGSLQDDVQALIAEASPAKPSSFEEQMDLQEDIDKNCDLIAESNMEDHMEMLKASMESTSSAEYGDENEIPLDSDLQNVRPMVPNVEELTCTPARVFETREIHTVSKVPLRPAGDEHSPPKIIKKRSKSISTFVPASRTPEKTHKKRNSIAACSEQAISLPKMASSALEQEERTSTPAKESSEVEEYDLLAHVPSPIGSSRKPDPGILKGIIAFVDVHTSEGADASGIFYDLLTQMGARCVKQWNWNPRASMAIGADSDDQLAGSTKPGISHVIYKDGGKRTLEKVRAAQGAVECVGVGWVLE